MFRTLPTATRTLVWIDAREAIVVSWLEDRAQVERLAASPSDSGEATCPDDPTRFVDEVAEHLPLDDDLLILGPSPIRDRLELRVHELDKHRRHRRAIAASSSAPQAQRQLLAQLRHSQEASR